MKKLGIHLLLIWSFFFIMKKDALCQEAPSAQQLNIDEFVEYPEAARKDNLSADVTLAFRVKPNGSVEVESVESEYDIFEKAVREQISQKVFENLDPYKLYKVVVHFKLL